MMQGGESAREADHVKKPVLDGVSRPKAARCRNSSFDDFIMQGVVKKPALSRVDTQVANSTCLRCLTMKLRCNGGWPCRNCMRAGVGGRCARLDAGRGLGKPEKPWAYRHNSYSLPLANNSACGPPLPPVMEIMSNLLGKSLGMPKAWINSILDNLPPKLYQTVFETICPLIAAMGLGPVLQNLQRTSSPTDPHAFPHSGYWSIFFGYETGVMKADINTGFAKLMDRHPEEVVDRMARSNLPPVSSEFDFLCVALDDLPFVIGGPRNGTQHRQRFIIVARRLEHGGQHDPLLMRITTKAQYNQLGRIVRMEKWFQPVTAAEFDTALELTPELVRPLQAAVGDRRSGGRLLQEHERDFQLDTIGAMAYRTEGRAKLDLLADAVKARYRPLVMEAVQKRLAAAAASAEQGSPAVSSASLSRTPSAASDP